MPQMARAEVQRSPSLSALPIIAGQKGKKVTVERCPMALSCLDLMGVLASDQESVRRTLIATCNLFRWERVSVTLDKDGTMRFIANGQSTRSMIAVLKQALLGWRITINID